MNGGLGNLCGCSFLFLTLRRPCIGIDFFGSGLFKIILIFVLKFNEEEDENSTEKGEDNQTENGEANPLQET